MVPGARVLVTGATGFTGSVLLRKLARLGHEVVAIARPSSNMEPFQGLPVQWVRGDVFDEHTVKEAVKGTSYIFHLATCYREARLSDRVYHQVHVLATQLLARAVRGQASFKRFIHVSTVGVHGHVSNPPADEDCPMNPEDIYEKTKAEAELWIRDFSAKEGLPLTVVRPVAVYGPGEKRLFKLFRMVSKKWVPMIGSGHNLYHLIHVDDLTDFLILAAEHPTALGGVFICGSPQGITFRQMATMIAEYYKIPVKFIRLPATPLFILARLSEFIFPLFAMEPPLHKRRLTFFTKDRSFNTRKMRTALGFVPSRSDEEGLREMAQWYLDHGWLSVPKNQTTQG